MERIESPRTDDSAIEAEIKAKGLTAPRITPADLAANIASEHYFTAHNGVHGASAEAARGSDRETFGYSSPESLSLLTFCVLVLRNGFTVTGESACASPENFDAVLGRQIARANAVNKVWPLMGYALKQQLHDASNQPPAPGAAHPGYNTMAPHQQRVVDEKAELGTKIHKLVGFFDTPMFASLAADEQLRLQQQAVAMDQYFTILLDRIAAFTPA